MVSISSGTRFAKGWSINKIGKLGRPKDFERVEAIPRKGCVTNVTVGIPRDSIVCESWTLHDEHDPQSPEAVSIRSGFHAVISEINGAGAAEVGLRHTLISPTPC